MFSSAVAEPRRLFDSQPRGERHPKAAAQAAVRQSVAARRLREAALGLERKFAVFVLVPSRERFWLGRFAAEFRSFDEYGADGCRLSFQECVNNPWPIVQHVDMQEIFMSRNNMEERIFLLLPKLMT